MKLFKKSAGDAMTPGYIDLPPVTVIGREGSTDEGGDFIERLWREANARFCEIAPLAKRDEHGRLCGIRGAMSGFARDFSPWEDGFTRGLYLAGAECAEDAQPPDGWQRWVIPAARYAVFENNAPDAFPKALSALSAQGQTLVMAAQDYTDPATEKNYIYLPVARL